MDPGNVLAGAEGGHLPAQAEKLVDILLPPAAEKQAVFLRQAAALQLFLRAKGEVQPEVKGQNLPLRVKEGPQKLEEAQRPVPLPGGVVRGRLGVEEGNRRPVGAEGPSLLRLGGGVQHRPEGLQGPAAGNPLLNGQQGGQQGGPIQTSEELLRPGAGELPQKRLLPEGLRQRRAQAVRLFHGFLHSARRGPVILIAPVYRS